jgi:hypothetical protein
MAKSKYFSTWCAEEAKTSGRSIARGDGGQEIPHGQRSPHQTVESLSRQLGSLVSHLQGSSHKMWKCCLKVLTTNLYRMLALYLFSSAPERDFLPTVEEYFDCAVAELNPANQVEEQYRYCTHGQRNAFPLFFCVILNPLLTFYR